MQEYQSVWCETYSRCCKYTWLRHISYYTLLPKSYKIPLDNCHNYLDNCHNYKEKPFLGLFAKVERPFYPAYDNCQKLKISARITNSKSARTTTIQNRLIHFFDFGDGSGVSIWQHGFDIIQKGWFQYAALRA